MECDYLSLCYFLFASYVLAINVFTPLTRKIMKYTYVKLNDFTK